MKIYISKTDFKKLEYKILKQCFFIIIVAFISGYFAKEISRYDYSTTSRFSSVVFSETIALIVIAYILYVKKIKSIKINSEKLYIEIEFIRFLHNYHKKTAYLKSLQYKIETEKGNQTLVFSDNKDFYFIVTEDEFTKEEQLEIADYLKEINCRPLNY